MPRHIKALTLLTLANVAAWAVCLAADWKDATILLAGSGVGMGFALVVLGVMAWKDARKEPSL